jgi:hypothetical protein
LLCQGFQEGWQKLKRNQFDQKGVEKRDYKTYVLRKSYLNWISRKSRRIQRSLLFE